VIFDATREKKKKKKKKNISSFFKVAVNDRVLTALGMRRLMTNLAFQSWMSW